jgi:hypothetical protein
LRWIFLPAPRHRLARRAAPSEVLLPAFGFDNVNERSVIITAISEKYKELFPVGFDALRRFPRAVLTKRREASPAGDKLLVTHQPDSRFAKLAESSGGIVDFVKK